MYACTCVHVHPLRKKKGEKQQQQQQQQQKKKKKKRWKKTKISEVIMFSQLLVEQKSET